MRWLNYSISQFQGLMIGNATQEHSSLTVYSNFVC